MSKRKNPFGVIAPVQLKVHVGAKEAATQEDMEEVYKRTRERLFGSRKKLSNGSSASHGGKGDASVCRCCNSSIKTTPSLPNIVCGACQFKLCSSSCLRECCNCGQSFCQFCTVLNYDTPKVRVYCLNCLSSFSFQSS